ncbi:MAG: threonine aldolase family protein [Paracoccaceae bacterium]
MFLSSDNGGPAHPKVIEAVMAANAGHVGAYGAEALAERVTGRIRDVLGWPEASVHLVATGTAANALILATLARPWQTVFCTPMAHVHEDECNAPEFYTGGAKLTLVPATDAKMTPETLSAAIEGEETRGVHGPQRGPVTITQVTEKGTLHSAEEVAALARVCRDHGLPLHMDGARVANAAAALGGAREMTAPLDALSFGATKTGCLGVEAAVLRDPGAAEEFAYRRKRGAHLFSKHRFLSAQMDAYLADDLWLELGARANALTARLAAGLRAIPGVAFEFAPQANMIFARMPRRLHARAFAAGAQYYLLAGDPDSGDPDEPLPCRLVTDWSLGEAEVDRFLDVLGG